MITQRCSIVLSTPRMLITQNPNVIELVSEVIHSNLCNVDYFGALLDNDADYIDEDMAFKMEATSYFKLHFDLSKEIDLDDYTNEDEYLNLFYKVILENEITEIRSDDKDITIYVNV